MKEDYSFLSSKNTFAGSQAKGRMENSMSNVMKTLEMTNKRYGAIIEEVVRHIERAETLDKLIELDQRDAWVEVYIEIDGIKISTTEHFSNFLSAVRRNLPSVGSCYNYINVGSFVDDGERGYYADNEEFFEWEE